MKKPDVTLGLESNYKINLWGWAFFRDGVVAKQQLFTLLKIWFITRILIFVMRICFFSFSKIYLWKSLTSDCLTTLYILYRSTIRPCTLLQVSTFKQQEISQLINVCLVFLLVRVWVFPKFLWLDLQFFVFHVEYERPQCLFFITK